MRLVLVTSFTTDTWFGTLVRVNSDGTETEVLSSQGMTMQHLVQSVRSDFRDLRHQNLQR
jgi:hypothetical protein